MCFNNISLKVQRFEAVGFFQNVNLHTLQRGANPRRRNRFGWSSLEYGSISMLEGDILPLLREAGAEAEVRRCRLTSG